MKKLWKVLKVLLIIVVSIAVIIYGGVFLGHKVIFREAASGVPTITALTDGVLTLGPQAHKPQPATMDEFIPLLAEQVKLYNEIAPGLWPDNALAGQSLIVEGLAGKRFWLIKPDGAITPLSLNEAMGYGINRLAYVNGFSLYDGGVYLAVAEKDLVNYLGWQKYLHFGMHDAFLFFTHEGFHMKEQPKWPVMSEIPNRARNDFLEDTPARAKRNLLQKQILLSASEPGNTQLILDALATYEDWKAQFPEDYKNSLYFARVEGTANYYELVTGLYCGYPDQIKDRDDLDRALALLATREDVYLRYGLVRECYTIDGFACVLLDRLEDGWKQQLTDDPAATPIEMLRRHFKDETLPAPKQLTQSEIDAIGEKIQNLDTSGRMPLFFRMLYDILF